MLLSLFYRLIRYFCTLRIRCDQLDKLCIDQENPEGFVGLSIFYLRPVHAIPSATEFWGLAIQGQVVLVSRADQCVLYLAVVPILGCKKKKKTVTSNQRLPNVWPPGSFLIGKYLQITWVSSFSVGYQSHLLNECDLRLVGVSRMPTKAQNPNPLVRLQKHHIHLLGSVENSQANKENDVDISGNHSREIFREKKCMLCYIFVSGAGRPLFHPPIWCLCNAPTSSSQRQTNRSEWKTISHIPLASYVMHPIVT